MRTPRCSARRFLGLCCLTLLGACVTESLAICVNCGGPFTIVEMRGGYRVVLSAATGGAVPCSSLTVHMASSISWRGCLTPRGGTVDSTRQVINLQFVDATGAIGTLSFSELEGGPDSAQGLWRASCVKLETASACPSWAGWSHWTRDSTPAPLRGDSSRSGK